MANTGAIKTFESPVDRLTPTNVGAEAYEMEGRHVEASYHMAGQDIGGAVAGLGQQLEQHDTTMQTAQLMKDTSDLEVQAHDALLNAKKTMNINDPDAVNKFMDGFQDQVDAITSKTYTPRAYDAMTRMMSDFNTRVRQNFTGYQAQAQSSQGMSNYEDAANNWGVLGNRDPTFLPAAIKALKIGGDNLDVAVRDGTVRQTINHVADATAEGIVSRVEGMKVYDPATVQAAKDYINDPKNMFVAGKLSDGSFSDGGMSSAKYTEVMNRLDNARRTGSNQTIAGAELNVPPMLNTVSLTGQVPDELTARISQLKSIGTPPALATAAKMEQDVLDRKGVYGARQLTSQLPSDQLSSLHDKLASATRDATLSGSQIAVTQAMANAAAPLLKERNEAFYGGSPVKQGQWNIDNNPAVSQAYDAWRANPNDPKAFLSYYEKSVGQQRYLEPGALPSVMTDDIANDGHKIMNEITNDPKAGPLQAGQDLDRMANLYGPAWPQIAGDLAKMKIFNGDQLVAAGLSSNPAAAGWRESLLKASAMKPDDLREVNGITAEKAQNLVRPEISQLVNSMGNINNAPELTDMYINAASSIVQMRGLTNASQLVKTMFLDSYQFVGAGSTIRLSAGFPNGDAVGDGSRAVLHDIGNHDLVVPSSARLGSVNAKEAWVDAIKANGVWYTSRDGRTATLYDGAATGNPVMENRNGKQVPVTLTFDELARLGKNASLTQTAIRGLESFYNAGKP